MFALHSRLSQHAFPGCRQLACVLSVALSLFFCMGQTGFAQAKNKAEDKVLITGDQWQIHISYFKSSLGREAPVVVCIHDMKSDRLVWHNGFAEMLNGVGYAVVTVDLRKHGESTGRVGAAAPANGGGTVSLNKDDYAAMVTEDLEAVKGFLYDEHQAGNLNMRKTALVSAGGSAPIAINYAVLDWLKKPHPDAPTLQARTPRGQDIQSFVFLSPEVNLSGLSSVEPLRNVLRNPAWNLSFLFCYGAKDRESSAAAKKLHALVDLPQNKERVYLQSYPYKLRGTDLLNQNINTEDHIKIFLEKNLLDLEGEQYEWRDRKSRI